MEIPKAPTIKITADMMKNFRTIECSCGGMIFESGLVIKKISALLSPSGKEEAYPIEVLVCKKCGKVPASLESAGIPISILPEEVIAKPPLSSGLFQNSGTGGNENLNTLT